MGIHGLMSYVGSKKFYFQDLQLKDTKLIIDGNNLYHKLYFESDLDLIHGGDYNSFTEIVHKFFESLFLCGIHAYVVFDGGCDISEKKLETQKQRVKEKIKMADSLSKGEGGTVLPLLVREVFIQVLEKIEVPFVQSFAEADRELVALANHWNCPVLTFDSDFCIFDLKAGFCPLSYFQWKNIVTSKGTSECYIQAKCFLARHFCKHFNNMNISLLPLFAVLMGNDYISLPTLERFFSKVNLPVGISSHGGRKHTRIHGLLHWLSAFDDAEKALDNVLKYLREQDRYTVRQLLCSAMEEYDLSSTVNLEQFFHMGIYVSPTAEMLKLPDWIQKSIANGQISPLLRDVLVLHQTFLHPQVEDITKPSAHLLTHPIRKVMYGLLLSSTSKLCKNHPDKILVVEFDRLEKSLKKCTTETNTDWNIAENLSLSSLPEVSISTRLQLLLDSLEVKMASLDSVPVAYHLPVAVTCYWVKHANPKVKLHHLKAILMGLICGELYDILLTPSKCSEDAKIVYEQLQKLIKAYKLPRTPNREDLQVFCQWQCCLQIGLYFNQLLLSPLLQPNVRHYNITLVHILCGKLKNTSSVEDVFSPSPPLKKLYQVIVDAIMLSIPQNCFQNRTKSRKCKTKKEMAEITKQSQEEHAVMENVCMCNVSNRFAGLMLDNVA
ncbi:hypothetical protein GDO86_011605 [Hymenochirus boettgeri]|uniref:Uncharacterized protein n=1 Tax=Hymenochirus boettgeri TaxID=247094 RepID=A0A8T2JH11_9PIPI|nr:hypothetical protein GDO86_011605 [Hymenochirus boettgeri]